MGPIHPSWLTGEAEDRLKPPDEESATTKGVLTEELERKGEEEMSLDEK